MSGTRADLNVLIVEDEFLVASLLRDILVAKGFMRIEHESSVSAALKAVAQRLPDLCFLDINLAGQMCFPVAAHLKANNVPFTFVTGFAENAVPEEWREHLRLEKPFSDEQLAATLAQLGV